MFIRCSLQDVPLSNLLTNWCVSPLSLFSPSGASYTKRGQRQAKLSQKPVPGKDIPEQLGTGCKWPWQNWEVLCRKTVEDAQKWHLIYLISNFLLLLLDVLCIGRQHKQHPRAWQNCSTLSSPRTTESESVNMVRQVWRHCQGLDHLGAAGKEGGVFPQAMTLQFPRPCLPLTSLLPPPQSPRQTVTIELRETIPGSGWARRSLRPWSQMQLGLSPTSTSYWLCDKMNYLTCSKHQFLICNMGATTTVPCVCRKIACRCLAQCRAQAERVFRKGSQLPLSSPGLKLLFLSFSRSGERPDWTISSPDAIDQDCSLHFRSENFSEPEVPSEMITHHLTAEEAETQRI